MASKLLTWATGKITNMVKMKGQTAKAQAFINMQRNSAALAKPEVPKSPQTSIQPISSFDKSQDAYEKYVNAYKAYMEALQKNDSANAKKLFGDYQKYLGEYQNMMRSQGK
ncbi:hypothetical protein HYY75_05695 [bacterium]|nr:hypothetical protein [bacterium]